LSHFSSEIKRIIKKIKGEEKETFILEICINAIFLLPLQAVIKNDYEHKRKNRILAQPSG
jgi:hypothetical protein